VKNRFRANSWYILAEKDDKLSKKEQRWEEIDGKDQIVE